ncbi:MAG: alpha/beta fold hydrolase [Verrucomicrobiales bacterium]|nr:alpha/beta fold hydrolase [Verrucomicrobiales bacterium]
MTGETSWLSWGLLALLVVWLTSCSTARRVVREPSLGAEMWSSFDGKTMPWQQWPQELKQPPQAIVLAVHGLSGAKSDFWYLGERLAGSGIACFSYDLRGQGNDPDRAARGDIRSARLWQRDLVAFDRALRQRFPEVPVFWLGESLGSLIVLHTVVTEEKSGGTLPSGVILTSPAVGLKMEVPATKRLLLRLLSRVVPHHRLSLEQLSGVDMQDIQVTSTTTHGGQMAQTPHHVDAFSLRLLRELDSLMRHSARAARQLSPSTLVLGSPHDVIASEAQIRAFFTEVAAQPKRLRMFPDSHHLLFHDVDRDTATDEVKIWTERVHSAR